MKKIASILLFAVAVLSDISAQPLNGLGTYASPYNGIFESDLQWNFTYFPDGKVYINGDVTIDNELLTVEAGMSVIFIAEGADLIINGTGSINATGTDGNQITFTADDNNNGNYGETNERWGHIVFDNPSNTNQSRFEYCVIEYGDVRTGSNTTSYGGGIYIRIYSNLVLNYCTIRNNRATHGGAIMLLAGSSPSFSGCIITNNIANSSGGAIYSQARNGLSLTNCLITFNTATSGNGGGIFFDGSDNSKIVNCNILKNSSLVGGKNIHLYNVGNLTTRPRFVNSIVWDADNSIDYSGTSVIRVTDFINCAIRDISTPASSFTNCIDLSAANGDPAGPNFSATDGSDWSIKFISPCRDAGTNSYGSPNIVPSLDYDENLRIYTTDIGAYEIQYSRWEGDEDTDWETIGNWEEDVDPSSGTGDVIIPFVATNFPDATAVEIAVEADKFLILDPGAQLSAGDLTNDGTIRLRSDATGIASIIIYGTHTNGGEEIAELYLAGNGTMWHYISPPTSSVDASIFSGSSAAVAQYQEELIDDDMNNGWVTSTGYHYDVTLATPDWVEEGWTWDYLWAGSGYNYYSASNKTFDISGEFNTGDITVDLFYNSGGFTESPDDQGYNLIGNPFTGGINWDDVLLYGDNPLLFPDDVEPTIYFRKNGLTYYYLNEVTVPDDDGTLDARYIPPMQGFFIKSNTDGVTLTLPSDAQLHTETPRFKGTISIPHIRLQIDNSTGSDQTVVRLDEKATLSYDNWFDASKIFPASGIPSISSSMEGKELAINGIPFPDNTTFVPLVINSPSSGSYTISAKNITDLENYNVYLIDNLQNTTIDLHKITNYSFNSSTGKISDRFVLKISNISTALPENTISNKPFNIYSSSEQINIQTLSDEWSGQQGDIKIIDLTGKTVSLLKNIEFSKDEIRQVSASGTTHGIYFVEISSVMKRYVEKVVIR